MTDLTIYEKRTCSTCRKLSALLAERGIESERVEYHVEGIDEATIRDLLAQGRPRPARRAARARAARRGARPARRASASATTSSSR